MIVKVIAIRRWVLLTMACFALGQVLIVTKFLLSSSPSSSSGGAHRSRDQPRQSRRLASKNEAPPLRPWIEPPPPLLSGNGRVWNATNIRWLGRSYYFENEPTYQQYTPHQIQKAFRKHSVLMIGDSTVRRLYGTLQGVLSHDVVKGGTTYRGYPKLFYRKLTDPPLNTRESRSNSVWAAIESGDADAIGDVTSTMHAPIPIDVEHLENTFVIDVNKKTISEPCSKQPPSCAVDGKNLTGLATYRVCRAHATGGWEVPDVKDDVASGHSLDYDHLGGACIPEFLDFLNVDTECGRSTGRALLDDYTLLVVSAGVWETTSKNTCLHQFGDQYGKKWPAGLYALIETTLQKLTELQSSKLAIVWRTSAYYEGDHYSHIITEMNRRAMAFIDEFNANQPPGVTSNLMYFDWGTTMITKSQGKDRLRGDMKAHYAVEARILQIQMMTNLLYERNLV